MFGWLARTSCKAGTWSVWNAALAAVRGFFRKYPLCHTRVAPGCHGTPCCGAQSLGALRLGAVAADAVLCWATSARDPALASAGLVQLSERHRGHFFKWI